MVLSSANCAVPGLILSVRIDYDPLIRPVEERKVELSGLLGEKCSRLLTFSW